MTTLAGHAACHREKPHAAMRLERWRFILLLVFPTLLVLPGCGGNQVPADSVATAQSALDEAEELIVSGQAAEALPLLQTAVSTSGLDVDQYVEAVLLRAQCYAATGELEKAQADLDEAEQGAPNPALWHFTRAIVFDAQGDAAAAKKEFARAKRLDPKLKMP